MQNQFTTPTAADIFAVLHYLNIRHELDSNHVTGEYPTNATPEMIIRMLVCDAFAGNTPAQRRAETTRQIAEYKRGEALLLDYELIASKRTVANYADAAAEVRERGALGEIVRQDAGYVAGSQAWRAVGLKPR